MAKACTLNYDPAFTSIAKSGDIFGLWFHFGTGSRCEQTATYLVAKEIFLVVTNNSGNVFSRNSINNALMGSEILRLINQLQNCFLTAHQRLHNTISKSQIETENRQAYYL